MQNLDDVSHVWRVPFSFVEVSSKRCDFVLQKMLEWRILVLPISIVARLTRINPFSRRCRRRHRRYVLSTFICSDLRISQVQYTNQLKLDAIVLIISLARRAAHRPTDAPHTHSFCHSIYETCARSELVNICQVRAVHGCDRNWCRKLPQARQRLFASGRNNVVAVAQNPKFTQSNCLIYFGACRSPHRRCRFSVYISRIFALPTPSSSSSSSFANWYHVRRRVLTI